MRDEPPKTLTECKSWDEIELYFPDFIKGIAEYSMEMPDVIGSDAHRAWFHRKYGEDANYNDWFKWLFDANKEEFTEMGLKRPES